MPAKYDGVEAVGALLVRPIRFHILLGRTSRLASCTDVEACRTGFSLHFYG